MLLCEVLGEMGLDKEAGVVVLLLLLVVVVVMDCFLGCLGDLVTVSGLRAAADSTGDIALGAGEAGLSSGLMDGESDLMGLVGGFAGWPLMVMPLLLLLPLLLLVCSTCCFFGDGGGREEASVVSLGSRLVDLSEVGGSCGEGGALLPAIGPTAGDEAGLAAGLGALIGCARDTAGTCAASLPL